MRNVDDPALRYAGGLLLAAGLALLWYSAVVFRRASRRTRWASTSGVVRSSGVMLSASRSGQAYRPQILYEYSVGGTHYRSMSWAYGREGFINEEDAQRIAARYMPGSLVRVYYLPGRPTVATLEPKLRDPSLAIIFSLSACVAIGLGILMLVATPGVPGAHTSSPRGMGLLSVLAYLLLLVLGAGLALWIGRAHGVYNPLTPTVIAGGGVAVIFAMLLVDSGSVSPNGVAVTVALWALVMAFVYVGFRTGRRPRPERMSGEESGTFPHQPS